MARAGTYARRRGHRERVMALTADGLSVTAIADRLGIRAPYAARLLREGLAALPVTEVDDLRDVTELRLDRASRAFGELLDSDDDRTKLAAAAGLKATEDSRARLLGLHQKAPTEGTP